MAGDAPALPRIVGALASNYRLTHLPFFVEMIGSSSIMYWVLPITPHIWLPMAAFHFFDMLSPVWQPQLWTCASRAKSCRLIFFSFVFVQPRFAGAVDRAAVIEHEALAFEWPKIFEVRDLHGSRGWPLFR